MSDNNELIKQFTEKGLHWGGRSSFIHPKMKKFVFTFKGDLALINLQKSQELWEKTFTVLRELISQGKTILFVGTQPPAGPVLKKYGEELNLPYITTRWLGGTITNFETFRKRLDYLAELEAKIDSPVAESYTKKERGLMQKEADDIKAKFDGLVKLKSLPDALFIFCGKRHRTALKEAKRKGVKVLGVFGLEDDPEEASSFIPLNDNTRLGIEFVMEKVKEAYLEFKPKPAAAKKEEGEIEGANKEPVELAPEEELEKIAE
jgi:small subunit ribosomal protein S2